jgi:hypothetical protein
LLSVRDVITTKVLEAGGRLTVRSALNPILWLCAIITVPSVVVIGLKESPPTWLVVIACAPVVTAIFGFVFLLFFDRDKLQSEDYQIRKRSLELIEEKGDPQAIAAISVEAIANPEQPALLQGGLENDR